MSNDKHLEIIEQGPDAWNQWRRENFHIKPDLSNVNLSNKNLDRINLKNANLSNANLSNTSFRIANFNNANLNNADLFQSDLFGSGLEKASLLYTDFKSSNLKYAQLNKSEILESDFEWSNLTRAEIKDANIKNTNFMNSQLIETNFMHSEIDNCAVYGTSLWNLKTEKSKQSNIIISDYIDPFITVENIEIAQFIYLLIENKKVRDMINTLSTKVVLILGNFKPERKIVLDNIRKKLLNYNYLPVIFDYDNSCNRDVAETVSTLAHISRFIIADITDPRSVPQELQRIIPNLPSVPIQPIIHAEQKEYCIFEHLKRFPWVLDTYYYYNLDDLLNSIEDKIIKPPEERINELFN